MISYNLKQNVCPFLILVLYFYIFLGVDPVHFC